LTKYLPYTKQDLTNVLVSILSFEKKTMVESLVNEVYRKSGASVFTFSIIAALWSSSRGMYSMIKGLDSVYDLDNDHNYFVLRIFSMFYTVIFAVMIIAMLLVWVFGNRLYQFLLSKADWLASVARYFIHKRAILSVIILTILFMTVYKFVTNRKSSFFKQWPGALAAAIGWIVCSIVCSMFMEGFTTFSYVQGSMAGIMILLLWLYSCMSLVFYGAEINYFLENKKNYHALVWAFRHNKRASKRRREQMRKEKEEEKYVQGRQKTDQ
jgi:membrane protein